MTHKYNAQKTVENYYTAMHAKNLRIIRPSALTFSDFKHTACIFLCVDNTFKFQPDLISNLRTSPEDSYLYNGLALTKLISYFHNTIKKLRQLRPG